MSKSLQQTQKAIASQGIKIDALDLADAVWLCAQIPDETVATPDIDLNDPESPTPELPEPPILDGDTEPETAKPEPTNQSFEKTAGPSDIVARGADAGSHRIQGSLVELPRVPHLPNSLEIERALRSIVHQVDSRTEFRIDEQATAEATAETGCLQLFKHPVKERWLDGVLVIECSPTMRLWQDALREFSKLLWRLGAFRELQTCYLNSFEPQPKLYRDRNFQRPVSGNRIHASNRNQLILHVTDCRSHPWLNGSISKLLEQWKRGNTVAVIHVLDSFMWKRTALKKTDLDAGRFAKPLRDLNLKAFQTDRENFLPMVGLTPRLLKKLGPLLKSEPGSLATCFKLPAKSDVTAAVKNQQFEPTQEKGDKAFEHFISTGSLESQKLARSFANIPLFLPIMRMTQHCLHKESGLSHLTEIFWSGIIYRRDYSNPISSDTDPDLIEYEFLPGIRDRLLNQTSFARVQNVFEVVSRYMAARLGQSRCFSAILHDPQGAEDFVAGELADNQKPFHRVASHVLMRIGGEYQKAGEQLASALSENESGFPLSFTFEFGSSKSIESEDPVAEQKIEPSGKSEGKSKLIGYPNANIEVEDGTNIAKGTKFILQPERWPSDLYIPGEAHEGKGWREGLLELRQRFQLIESAEPVISCKLVQMRIPEYPGRSTNSEWFEESQRFMMQMGGGLSKDMVQLGASKRIPLFGEFALSDVEGTAIQNTASEPFAFRYGLSRSKFLFQNDRSLRQKSQFIEASELGTELLYQLPREKALQLWKYWPEGFSRGQNSDEYLWVCALFELGWDVEKSSEMRIARFAQSDDLKTQVELTDKGHFPRIPSDCLAEEAGQIAHENGFPVEIYSEIQNAASYSIKFIETLLHAPLSKNEIFKKRLLLTQAPVARRIPEKQKRFEKEIDELEGLIRELEFLERAIPLKIPSQLEEQFRPTVRRALEIWEKLSEISDHRFNWENRLIVELPNVAPKVMRACLDEKQAYGMFLGAIKVSRESGFIYAIPYHKANLGRVSLGLGDTDEGLRYLEEAATELSGFKELAEDAASLNAEVGSYLEELNHLDDAEIPTQRAIEIYRSLGEDENVNDLLKFLGTLYHRQHRHDEAERCYRTALKSEIRLSSKSATQTAIYLSQLLDSMGRPKEAVTLLLEHAHQARKKGETRLYHECNLMMAVMQREFGQVGSALRLSREAASFASESDDLNFLYSTTTELASCLSVLKRYDEADDELKKLFSNSSNQFLELIYLATAKVLHGNVLRALGQNQSAIEALGEASEKYWQLGANEPSANADFALAEAMLANGQLEEAHSVALKALGKFEKADDEESQNKVKKWIEKKFEAKPKYEFDVFLSHARSDKSEIVLPLLRELNSLGISCWVDSEQIQGGQQMPEAISNGIKSSKLVLAVISESFAASKWARHEVSLAMTREIDERLTRVIPLVAGDEQFLRSEFPLLANKLHLSWENNAIEIAAKIKTALDQVEFQPDLLFETTDQVTGKKKINVVQVKSKEPESLSTSSRGHREDLFVRNKDIVQVKELMRVGDSEKSRDVQFITSISGTPGIGKSAIAVELARDADIAKTFSDGVCWVELGQPKKSKAQREQQLETAIGSLNQQISGDNLMELPLLRQMKEKASETLRHKELLIVLDDVWDSDHVAIFRDLVPQQCSLLVTTPFRKSADPILDERCSIFDVPDLEFAEAYDLLRRVMATNERFDFERYGSSILQASGMLPATIITAGRTFLKAVSLGQKEQGVLEAMLDRSLLDSNLPRMSGDSEEVRSLSSVWTWAYMQLSEVSRQKFYLLVQLVGLPTVTFGNLKSVWGEDTDLIVGELVDFGMIRFAGKNRFDERHYGINEFLYQFASRFSPNSSSNE